MTFEKWQIPAGFEDLPEVVYRNRFASNLLNYKPEDICKAYVYMDSSQMRELVQIAVRENQYKGKAVELGAGCALLASTFASLFPGLKKVYAIEIVSGFPAKIMPIIANHVIKENPQRLVPVLGSFDNIELPDNSVDLAFEIDSLHHSHDLSVTLQELNRVMKKGGTLIAFDRAHANSTTDAEIESMLNKVYDEDFIKSNFYPEGTILTRRENGEHEIRFREWENYFREAGFELKETIHVKARPNLKRLIKAILKLILPNSIFRMLSKSLITRIQAKERISDFFTGIRWSLISQFRTDTVMHSKLNTTIFICEK
jgi:ubiquinone/menaquinone biosynthesis C-methylase UbiE